MSSVPEWKGKMNRKEKLMLFSTTKKLVREMTGGEIKDKEMNVISQKLIESKFEKCDSKKEFKKELRSIKRSEINAIRNSMSLSVLRSQYVHLINEFVPKKKLINEMITWVERNVKKITDKKARHAWNMRKKAYTLVLTLISSHGNKKYPKNLEKMCKNLKLVKDQMKKYIGIKAANVKKKELEREKARKLEEKKRKEIQLLNEQLSVKKIFEPFENVIRGELDEKMNFSLEEEYLDLENGLFQPNISKSLNITKEKDLYMKEKIVNFLTKTIDKFLFIGKCCTEKIATNSYEIVFEMDRIRKIFISGKNREKGDDIYTFNEVCFNGQDWKNTLIDERNTFNVHNSLYEYFEKLNYMKEIGELVKRKMKNILPLQPEILYLIGKKHETTCFFILNMSSSIMSIPYLKITCEMDNLKKEKEKAQVKDVNCLKRNKKENEWTLNLIGLFENEKKKISMEWSIIYVVQKWIDCITFVSKVTGNQMKRF